MKKLKRKISFVLWLLFGVATFALLGASVQSRDNQQCKNIIVEIKGADDYLFIDEKVISEFLSQQAHIINNNLKNIPLRKLEEQLEKNPWIYNAELFFDNNRILHVNIFQRLPLARIFTLQGNSFYIDEKGVRLPLSNRSFARVPFFTGFPSDNAILSKPDSMVLNQVIEVARLIAADSFWMAQTAQVHIQSNKKFTLIPLIGDQEIELGNATNLEEKFQNLFAFYQHVWKKTGFEKYSRINVEFEGQVVATRRNEKLVPVVQKDSSVVSDEELLAVNNDSMNTRNDVKPFDDKNISKQITPKAVMQQGKKIQLSNN